jgi:hypothetical protein
MPLDLGVLTERVNSQPFITLQAAFSKGALDPSSGAKEIGSVEKVLDEEAPTEFHLPESVSLARLHQLFSVKTALVRTINL